MIVVLHTRCPLRRISCLVALILPKRSPSSAGLSQQCTGKLPSGLSACSLLPLRATIIAVVAEVFNFTLKIHEYSMN